MFSPFDADNAWAFEDDGADDRSAVLPAAVAGAGPANDETADATANGGGWIQLQSGRSVRAAKKICLPSVLTERRTSTARPGLKGGTVSVAGAFDDDVLRAAVSDAGGDFVITARLYNQRTSASATAKMLKQRFQQHADPVLDASPLTAGEMTDLVDFSARREKSKVPKTVGTKGTRAGLAKRAGLMTMPMLQTALLAKHGKKRSVKFLHNVVTPAATHKRMRRTSRNSTLLSSLHRKTSLLPK